MAKYKVVHLSTYMDGGAATAAYRIHVSLLKAGVDSSFLSTQQIVANEFKNVYLQDTRPAANSIKTGFFEREINRVKFRIKKYFGISIIKARESAISLFDSIEPRLDCEIATLPFSEYNILDNPLVQNADIIHLHWVAGMIDYPSFFKDSIKPIVWTLHDMNPFQGLFHYKEDETRNHGITNQLDRKISRAKRKAIKGGNANLQFVTPTHWLYNKAKQSRVFKHLKGACIPYPVDVSVFAEQQSNDLKQAHSIPEQNIILLFVAHSIKVHRKGFDLLIEALKKLNSLSITLLVLGNSEQLKEDGLNIIHLGNISDHKKIAKYYSLADAFIIPSREDNLPNVMLESLACGTPVIGFAIGGIREHIVDFKTGLLANEMSVEGLSSAIKIFCEKKELFNKAVIKEYARANFSEAFVAEQYQAIYQQLLN